ncbi:MAG: epimerase [Phenylobacterium sp.]|nr:epimerase [Phenylobacterium sp.]
MAPRVAVTGATGFLGRHLVRALAEAGWSVRALVRRDPVAAFGATETEVVIGGLADAAAMARLCAGAEVLVHAAGLVKARSRAEFQAVNAEGARRAALAAEQAGVPRMVLVSSLAAREPQLSAYAASKAAGEAAAAEVLGERLAILRPPAIYGPGDLETLAVFRLAACSPLLPTFDPRARIAMIHAADAARQIAAAAAGPPERSPAALSDARPEGYGWREIAEAAAEAVGRRSRPVRLPGAALALAGAAGSLARALGGNPMLTPGKARELRWPDWSVRPDELWAAAPRAEFGLRDGFAQTVRWWREAKRLVL